MGGVDERVCTERRLGRLASGNGDPDWLWGVPRRLGMGRPGPVGPPAGVDMRGVNCLWGCVQGEGAMGKAWMGTAALRSTLLSYGTILLCYLGPPSQNEEP